MIGKIRTPHNHPKGRIFSIMVLILGFSAGMINTVLPNFIRTIVETNAMVSFFYSGMAIVMFFAAILSTIIFKKIKRTTITKLGLFIPATIIFLFIFVTRIHELTVFEIVRVCSLLFLLMSLCLFVRDFAKEKSLGKAEGVFYRFINVGLFLGPLVAGFLGSRFNYESVFVIASLVLFGGFLYFHHQHVVENHPSIINKENTSPIKFWKNVGNFFSNSGRVKAYFITMTLYLWLASKNLYIPLYVVFSGYLESMTGLILAFGILPFILLEVKVGEYADKKGVRLPISLGFLIMAILLFIIFLNPYPLLNFPLFVLMSFGAALVEPLPEYILFKHLPKNEEDNLYGIYMTANPIAHFVAPSLGGLILLFLPFNYIFLALGLIILAASAIFYFTRD